jgi:hypothetical protein
MGFGCLPPTSPILRLPKPNLSRRGDRGREIGKESRKRFNVHRCLNEAKPLKKDFLYLVLKRREKKKF